MLTSRARLTNVLAAMRFLRPLLGLLILAACGGGDTTNATDAGNGNDVSAKDASSSLDASEASATNDASSQPDGAAQDATSDVQTIQHDYSKDGASSVTTFTASVTHGSSTFNVQGYLPSGAGPFPVVVLSSGLLQPAAGYAFYGQRLASWGIIALLRDDPGITTQSTTIAADVTYVVGTWLAAQNAASTSKLYQHVDTSKVGLAGHSRGGEVSLLAAEGGAKGLVKGVFGLDPVDGNSGTVAITTIGSIGVPIAFIGETTDSGTNDCAPSAQNFLSLYGAASTPAVAITANNADHVQLEDPRHCSFCTLCTPGSAQQAVVAATANHYLMAFFARELLGDTTVGAAFQGAGISADVNAAVVSVASK